MVGPIVDLFVVFLCSGFRSPLSHMLCFITVFVITCICVSLFCFTDEVDDSYADRTYVCNFATHQKTTRFRASRTGQNPQ